jgi:D-glycerate 3-kinase
MTLTDQITADIVRSIAAQPGRMLVVGLCGAQGSGKSTLANAVLGRLEQAGLAAAVLSLDDLYLTRAEREELARGVHPLLATRGVPGTHDVALGRGVIAALERGEPAALPRFDKARDDRAAVEDWGQAPAGCQVLLFEGWCVGAKAQEDSALVQPINALERDEDADGVWRHYANSALAGPYQALFARIDRLVLLAAPGFDVVLGWRQQQEDELRARAGAHAPGVMDEMTLVRFIQHYERLTRHILTEMLPRADILALLAEDRSPREVLFRP